MNRKMRHIRATAMFCLAAVIFVGVAGAAETKNKAKRQAELIKTIKSNAPQAEKDLACRELQVIGTEACIDALAAMLTDAKLSHMARYALEPMPYPKAATVMRAALAKGLVTPDTWKFIDETTPRSSCRNVYGLLSVMCKRGPIRSNALALGLRWQGCFTR